MLKMKHGEPKDTRPMTRLLCRLMLGLMICFGSAAAAEASCRVPQPPAMAFPNQGGSCPSGYYSSGNSCTPSGSSARYAFFNGDGSCPSGYYSSGNSCVASSDSACHAFFNGGGSCPSGYYSSGNSCVSS